jgi:hypothetical protein
LRPLTDEALRNLSLLRLAQVELFLRIAARRVLSDGQADAAEKHKREQSCWTLHSHDLLLLCWIFR